MFKQISSGFSKFFSNQRVLILVIFLVLAFVLYNYSDSKKMRRDGMRGKPRFSSPSSMNTTTTMPSSDVVLNNIDNTMSLSPAMLQNNEMMMPPYSMMQYNEINPELVYPDTGMIDSSAMGPQIEMMSNINEGGYHPQNTGHPNELLPSDENKRFGNFDMINQGNIVMPDLLDAGYLHGLDTVGQTLRNANYQERSDPIIPRMNVGPWNNSTIEPDLGRVPLEIGSAMR